MGIYNVLLVVKNKIIVIGAADKTDDKMILYHKLTELHTQFIKKYNSQNELDSWTGNIQMFLEFGKDINDTLNQGRIGVVNIRVPILKIFKKPFLKSFNELFITDLDIYQDNYKKIKDTEEKPEWLKEKVLPKQTVAQGFLSSKQYEVAHLINGFSTAEEISSKVNLPVEEIYKILKILDDLGLLTYVEIK